ncbi:MAG TPA: hypothetical protein VI260_21555 [Blastocatellia bacterium]|jgi:hypothetical protein
MRAIQRPLFIIAILILMISGIARARGPSRQSKEASMLRLTKKLIYENQDLNLIWEMKLGKFGTDKTSLMVVGSKGACLLTLVGQPVRCISYASLNLHSVQVVELPKQNTYAFVAGGIWGEPAAVLMDSEGKVKWRYDAEFKAMGAPALIDLGSSGERVVAMFEKDRGLLFFDLDSGKLLNVSQPSAKLRSLRAIDLDGDGHKELLANDTADRLITINSSAEVVMPTESQVFSFAVTQANPPNIVAAPDIARVADDDNKVVTKSGKIFLYDRKLQRVASWDAPHPYPGTSYLSLVAAEPLGPPNRRRGLVSLFSGTGRWRKTPLFVHSWEGKLIYEELLEDNYFSVLPLLDAEQGAVSFLVGGRGQVWRYSSAAR